MEREMERWRDGEGERAEEKRDGEKRGGDEITTFAFLRTI